MKATSGIVLGILFVIGQGFVVTGQFLESLDGPATATAKVVKLSAKAIKHSPGAVKAVARAIH